METKNNSVTESNKLIAEFMGWKTKGQRALMPHTYTWVHLEQMKWNRHWDVLMSVVDKIEGLQPDGSNWIYCVTIERDFCVISENGEAPIAEAQANSKIEAVYQAVIKFIEFHNQR